jgi:hypothetical protein
MVVSTYLQRHQDGSVLTVLNAAGCVDTWADHLLSLQISLVQEQARAWNGARPTCAPLGAAHVWLVVRQCNDHTDADLQHSMGDVSHLTLWKGQLDLPLDIQLPKLRESLSGHQRRHSSRTLAQASMK